MTRTYAGAPTVRRLKPSDRDAWHRMRRTLWPDCAEAIHRHEMEALLSGGAETAVFVLEDGTGGEPAGFVEVSARPYAEACHSGRVGYVEGWYVAPELRRRGYGARLLRAAEEWARAAGCHEMASDTEIDNVTSQAAHARLGYADVGRLVHFRKPLA